MSSKKRKTPFQNQHGLQFGVRVVQRQTVSSSSSNQGSVISAECLFCVYFGREAKVGSKRSRTENIKYFKPPFRTDVYKQHLQRQHPECWTKYQNEDDAGKKAFFEEQVPLKTTLHSYFGTKQIEKNFVINAPIVDVIIGDMLWDPEDIECETRSKMMLCFTEFVDNSKKLPDGQGVSRYRVSIKNMLQFSLGVDFLSVGLSFRQAARVLLQTKERSGLASIGSCSESTISKYARIACAVNLQKIYDLLDKAWTFSIALDMSTHMSTSYLDIRIRLHLNKHGILNVHILAVPVYERHTAEVIFDTSSKALDALCPSWRDTIIGISTDGERKMTGRITGVATRFQKVAKDGFIRIWCGAHQLDIVLQSAYKNLGDKLFYQQLTTLISYLRRQQNFVADLKSKAPKVADTRWESMYNVSKWFQKNKIYVDTYVEDKKPSCAPSHGWWIYIMVVAEFSSLVTLTFKMLQGHQVTVSMQRESLISLKSSLLSSVGGRGPLSEPEAAVLVDSEWVLSECRRFSASILVTKELVLNLGSFVTKKLTLLDACAVENLVKDVANLYVSAAAGIEKVVAERNEANEDGEALPPVVPHQLAALSHSKFCSIVATHRERLLASGWTPIRVDAMEQEHKDLVRAIATETTLRDAVYECNDGVSFDDGWSIVKGRFEALQCFAGGIATVFPGTSQVESDFSIVKAEKDDFRTAITDLSLEGVLHSKQFSKLAYA